MKSGLVGKGDGKPTKGRGRLTIGRGWRCWLLASDDLTKRDGREGVDKEGRSAWWMANEEWCSAEKMANRAAQGSSPPTMLGGMHLGGI